jgi:hypothetical protein
VEVPVPTRSLAHWDTDSHAWTIEPWTFRLTAGRSYGNQRRTIDIAVAGPSGNAHPDAE